ncbi:DUF4116 domain-containing protein [Acinetobacter sp. ANC 5380]|uniref:DUF4116 domain-containing protein n=1 Tax=Acinetobacter terrae TaxID=2731247 RepID=A0A7Y2RDC1_9GAMM|nr:DUF4116 domain-containing protein [Acinetobacter terrae]NNH76509.1 DUF4116 domain-containing protein [Acinetobacter terrae]
MGNTNLEFRGVSTEEEALAIVKMEPTIITSFPETLLTEKVLYEAIIRDSKVYDLIDRVFFSDTLIGLLLIDHAEIALEKLNHGLVKKHHVLGLVKSDGLTLRFLPPNMINHEICLAAIDQNVQAHEYVPKHLRDEKYINQLIKQAPDYAGRIDVAKRDPKILKDLVEEYPFIISYMSMTDRTKEVCEIVLQDHVHWIQYFPEHVYNAKDMLEKLSNLEYFSQPEGDFESSYVRPSLATYLFEKNKDVYKYLPKSVIDFDMAMDAVRHDYRNILITPLALRKDGKLWEEALKTKPELYKQIPLHEQSDTVRIFIARTNAQLNKQLSTTTA